MCTGVTSLCAWFTWYVEIHHVDVEKGVVRAGMTADGVAGEDGQRGSRRGTVVNAFVVPAWTTSGD